eukprot:6043592-Amphidinium_carterae.1
MQPAILHNVGPPVRNWIPSGANGSYTVEGLVPISGLTSCSLSTVRLVERRLLADCCSWLQQQSE